MKRAGPTGRTWWWLINEISLRFSRSTWRIYFGSGGWRLWHQVHSFVVISSSFPGRPLCSLVGAAGGPLFHTPGNGLRPRGPHRPTVGLGLEIAVSTFPFFLFYDFSPPSRKSRKKKERGNRPNWILRKGGVSLLSGVPPPPPPPPLFLLLFFKKCTSPARGSGGGHKDLPTARKHLLLFIGTPRRHWPIHDRCTNSNPASEVSISFQHLWSDLWPLEIIVTIFPKNKKIDSLFWV